MEITEKMIHRTLSNECVLQHFCVNILVENLIKNSDRYSEEHGRYLIKSVYLLP